MAEGLVKTRLEDGLLVVTLARPEKLNALTPAMVRELDAAIAAALEPEVRVVVLLGEGRSFCAGADVTESLGIEDLERAHDFLTALAAVLTRISSLPKPVIAAIQGHAVGGGAELALEADIRLAADDACLGFPDVALGSTPATLYALVRLIGRGRALEMAMLGTELDAASMERLGVVSRVVPREALEREALVVAGDLRDRASARSLRFAKEAVLHAEHAREADLRANINAMLACYGSPEQRSYVGGFGTGRDGGSS
jgi:enoyl-CoA hydratase/carnithine racemase